MTGLYQSSVSGDGALNGWSQFRAPIIIAHRGCAAVEAESSMTAFRRALGGTFPVETDVQVTADGAAVCMHDASIDRTTTGTGPVSVLTLTQIRATALDPSTWLAPGYSNESVPLFTDFLRLCNGVRVMIPEGKSTAATAQIVRQAQVYGVPADNLVVQSFSLSDLAPVVAAGYRALLLTGALSSPPSWAAVAAAGVNLCGYLYTGASDAAQVTAARAAGVQCIAYTVARRSDMATALACGAVGVFTDDPEYLAATAPMYYEDRWKGRKWMPGTVANVAGYRGHHITDECFGVDSIAAASYRGVLAGWLGPLPSTWVMSVEIAWDTVNNDTRWAGIFVCAQGDAAYDDSNGSQVNGYHIVLRRNGDLLVYKKTAGNAATVLAAVASGVTITINARVRFEITVTPTTVSVKNTATNTTATGTDSEFRGGYVHLGSSGAAVRYASLNLRPT